MKPKTLLMLAFGFGFLTFLLPFFAFANQNDTNTSYFEVEVTPLDQEKLEKQNKTDYFLTQLIGNDANAFEITLNEKTFTLTRSMLLGIFVLCLAALLVAVGNKYARG